MIQRQLFIRFYALYYFFFMGYTRFWGVDIFDFFIIGAAFLVLYKPVDLYFLVYLILLSFGILMKLPDIPNVIFMTLMVNLILISGVKYWYGKTMGFEPLRKVILFCIMVLYFFAFFHKLNTDFLDPEYSCGSELFAALFQPLPFIKLPESVFVAIIYLTLVFELCLPVLLWFRKTRILALVMGGIMHLLFAGTHYDFTSFIFALYILFIPTEFWEKTLGNFESKIKWLYIGIVALLAVIITWNLSTINAYRIMLLLWFLVYLPFLGILIKHVYTARKGLSLRGDFQMKKLHPMAVVFGLILVFNALNPYLGLKTEYSFAMFSNLRTEGGKTNHLIISEDWKLTDYQEDLVEIIDSSVPELQLAVRDQRPVTYFTLKKSISRNNQKSGFFVEYRYHGKEYHHEAGDPLDELKSYPNEWLLFKFIRFRHIQLGEHVKCAH